MWVDLQMAMKFEMRVSSQATKLNAGLDLQIISAMYKIDDKWYEKIAQVSHGSYLLLLLMFNK